MAPSLGGSGFVAAGAENPPGYLVFARRAAVDFFEAGKSNVDAACYPEHVPGVRATDEARARTD
jgi:hypothetical protein